MIAISTSPPIHSAAANCQPISRYRMMPSSSTRLVEEKRNARLGISPAPFLKSVLLIAAAAYEHDELAAPKPVASAISRMPSRPSTRCIRSLETRACTAPDSAKPRTRLQPTCHAIPAASSSASPSLASIGSAIYIFIVACAPWSLTCAPNQAWIAATSAGSRVV